MDTNEIKVKLVKGNSVIYATLRKGEFKRFTKDGETVCDGEFQKLGGAPETRHGDYAAMKRLFHEFVGSKCVDGYTVEGSAAAALGRMGGASTSPAKRAASRTNGAKGGRPATSVEDCYCNARRGVASARGYYADGRFRVSAREAARLCRVWDLANPADITELWVYGDDGARVPVWTP